MESFFLTLFAVVYLVITLSKDSSANKQIEKKHVERQAIKEAATDDDLYEALCKKVQFDWQNDDALFKKFRDKVHSLPGLQDAEFSRYADARMCKDFVIMMEMAEKGKVPFGVLNFNTPSSDFRKLFESELSDKQVTAFFRWYEKELRRHGMYQATIKAIVDYKESPQQWYFEKCSIPPSGFLTKRMW